ncbi:hypothetical protein HF577_35805, partial [Pseudonocardia xinjiangensis]|nr:hypothetical protein [Pseudonocardia xinjiangensis]
MSIMIPKPASYVLALLLGGVFPPQDEDEIGRLADAWVELVPMLKAAGIDPDEFAKQISANVSGSVGRKFIKFSHQLAEVQEGLAGGVLQQAAALHHLKAVIEEAKYGMLIEAIWTAFEIAWALSDPFTAPLWPSFFAKGAERIATMADKLSANIVRIGQFAHAAASEAVEEVLQDILAQVIVIAKGDKSGLDPSSIVASAGLGAAGGAFGAGGNMVMHKFAPKFAGSWKGASLNEGATEAFVGGVQVPMGGGTDDIGWGVANGHLSGAVTYGAEHFWHTADDVDVPKGPEKLAAAVPPPSGGAVAPWDGPNRPSDHESPPPYDGSRLPPYESSVVRSGPGSPPPGAAAPSGNAPASDLVTSPSAPVPPAASPSPSVGSSDGLPGFGAPPPAAGPGGGPAQSGATTASGVSPDPAAAGAPAPGSGPGAVTSGPPPVPASGPGSPGGEPAVAVPSGQPGGTGTNVAGALAGAPAPIAADALHGADTSASAAGDAPTATAGGPTGSSSSVANGVAPDAGAPTPVPSVPGGAIAAPVIGAPDSSPAAPLATSGPSAAPAPVGTAGSGVPAPAPQQESGPSGSVPPGRQASTAPEPGPVAGSSPAARLPDAVPGGSGLPPAQTGSVSGVTPVTGPPVSSDAVPAAGTTANVPAAGIPPAGTFAVVPVSYTQL